LKDFGFFFRGFSEDYIFALLKYLSLPLHLIIIFALVKILGFEPVFDSIFAW
jgi:hypothetical protein